MPSPDPIIDFSLDAMFGLGDDEAPAAARPVREPAFPRRPRVEPDRRVSAVLVAEFNALKWVPVTSSNLEYVSYAPGIGRLWVWFRRNGNSRHSVYAYDHVPQATYDGLMAAGSKGSYFSRNIRNVYAVTPIA